MRRMLIVRLDTESHRVALLRAARCFSKPHVSQPCSASLGARDGSRCYRQMSAAPRSFDLWSATPVAARMPSMFVGEVTFQRNGQSLNQRLPILRLIIASASSSSADVDSPSERLPARLAQKTEFLRERREEAQVEDEGPVPRITVGTVLKSGSRE